MSSLSGLTALLRPGGLLPVSRELRSTAAMPAAPAAGDPTKGAAGGCKAGERLGMKGSGFRVENVSKGNCFAKTC